MKTVKKRTVSIIHELIGNEELMTLSELAEKFEVSQRTIRNDLKLINELLKEMDLGKIRLVGGRIICPSSFGQVLKAVPKDDLYTYKLSQEERIEIAASFLINTVEYITMSVIADNLVVSRSTVINDLSKIKAYIGQGNLKVLSHPNKGLRVEGKESDKRLFLMNIKGNGVEKEQKDIVESIVLKIVIIEDDKILREELEILLNDSGYQAEILSDFTDAAAQVRQIRPDLVLLDIILPGANGQYILRQIREKSDVPVIMLTSKDGEVEEIMSRSSGADDYVTKPYNPTILLLRIETILRRTEQTGRQSEQRASSVRGEKAEGEAVQEELQDEELRLNLLRSTVSYHGDEVVLSKNELAILHCLMSRKGQIVSRDELMDHLWDMSEFVDDNTLTVNINRLRKRLAQIGLENKIETRRGQGYLLL